MTDARDASGHHPLHRCALLWLRRDLRLTDNPALSAALTAAESVVPVYIDDPDAEAPWAPGAASRAWLHHSLAALDAELRRRGSALILRRGDTRACLLALLRETRAGAVYWNRLYEPAVIARDRALKSALHDSGVDAQSFNAALLAEPWTLRTGAGGSYRVFTPFWRALQTCLPAVSVTPAPARIPAPRRLPDALPLAALDLVPRLGWDRGFDAGATAGETGALKRLRQFIDTALEDYADHRDLPAADGASALSPHLHFGEIGPRQIRAALQAAQLEHGAAIERGAAAFLRELGWREFAHHLLFHFPQTPDAPLDARFAGLRWRRPADYAADLAAWQHGRTGIPIVDAGMRELWTTGRMHNRVRMIAASFLTKNLLIPWQEGARWFWDTLIDADLANNTLGWQWVAGCGADAAPWFRVFNPLLQARKFDPQGVYLRRWLPELAALPDHALQAPGALHGAHYPAPIVDLAASRERALDAYALLRRSG